MLPYYQDNHNTLYNIDFRENDLPDECVQMVCTSPPYWGLRKYSGEQELIWGGDKDCEHQWTKEIRQTQEMDYSFWKTGGIKDNTGATGKIVTNTCSLCGAWKGAYGLEPTPEMYIKHTIEILREIRRVLRKDGVVFWNIGDSYWGGAPHHSGEKNPGKEYYTEDAQAFGTVDKSARHDNLKPKDLCLIPFKIAIAAQEDGWWVRSVIIWSKPNPMPESVTDRPTESHEYILMLTKSAKYYWDADAVREGFQREYDATSYPSKIDGSSKWSSERSATFCKPDWISNQAVGRNIRTVWEFPTQPYPEAHFAVFPEKLPELCIKAATPEVGCCSKCGAPWERIRKPTEEYAETLAKSKGDDWFPRVSHNGYGKSRHSTNESAKYQTLGWQPTCKCNADKVPSICLDPFAGAGTTLWVAKKLNRQAIGYEISEEYCQLAIERNRQQALMFT